MSNSNQNASNTSNEGKFDLSGVFDVQQDYITDLSGSYPNVNNAPLVAKQVLKLQDKIQDVTQSYDDANTSANNVLTEQNNMINIVTDEQKRLDEKKFLIDQAEMEQQRKVTLTDSNRLRNAQYTKIIMVFIFMVFVHIVLLLISKHAFEEGAPEGVDTIFILLHIFNIALCFIVAIYLYINIQSRSQIHFDQLELPPPSLTGDASSPTTSNYNNLFKDLGICVGDSCCGSETKWDSTTKTCESSEPENKVIEGYSSLLVNPSFISDKKSMEPDSDEVVPFDATTATDSEITAKVEQDVANSMSSFADLTANVGADAENAANEAIAAGAEISNQLSSDMGSSISDSLNALDTNVKCNFDTMENAYPNMRKANRITYKPSDSNVLLPSNTNLEISPYKIKGGNIRSNLFTEYP